MNSERNLMKEVRESLGLTQQGMADEMQTSLMTVRRCEYEKRTPGTVGARKAFIRLARKAGVSIEETKAEQVAA